ncbi:putative methyltransferase YcgJ [Roseimaritima multifibrata]|uniref:Putative methyltransferase YcgJ n=2 Tax=Roseimaritima multifibrata TaxID=1930274 RepID=A0A517MFQ5_9BACT|nr:putative methyltransferase YcgJ [Roseimaritima multifibrata]
MKTTMDGSQNSAQEYSVPNGHPKGKLVRKANPERSHFYSKFTPAYEAVWPLLLQKRILRSIEKLHIPARAKVLEVGIGTGISMSAYPQHAEVVGIDLSNGMLDQARQKIEREGWKHIHVEAMNAEELTFPDQTFDFITTFHVLSVVANPLKMMSEVTRVLKPGGKVLIINHLRSETPWLAKVIDQADPLTRHLGWRTKVGVEDVVGDLPLDIRVQRKSSPLSLFTILQATKRQG